VEEGAKREELHDSNESRPSDTWELDSWRDRYCFDAHNWESGEWQEILVPRCRNWSYGPKRLEWARDKNRAL